MVVRADGILDRCPRGNQALFELPAKPRSTRRTLTHPLEELHDERDMEGLGQRRKLAVAALEPVEVGVRSEPTGAGLDQLLGQTSQVIDQRQLEHTGPGPQLADRERRDRLERVNEAVETLRVEPGIAVAQHLHGHRVDPRGSGALARRELWKPTVVAAREAVSHLADLTLDEREVVE